MQRLMPLMEEQVAASEGVLTELLDKLSDMVREKKGREMVGRVLFSSLAT